MTVESTYQACEVQMERIDEGLDAVMTAMRILRMDGKTLVDLETVASILSLAHAAISEVTDEIRGDRP